MDHQTPIAAAVFRAPAPVEVRDLFRPERENLLHLLSSLKEDDWLRPTICSGWKVKDIALHLLGVDLGNLSRRRDQFSDPWWQPAGNDLVSSLNQWNDDWVVAARRLSPRLLCELLAVTGEAIDSYFQTLDPFEIGAAVSWVGPEPAPVWLDIAREYTERWVHQQQIRDALDRPGLKEPRFLAPVLATFVYALPHCLREMDSPPGTFLRLVIEGEAGGEWIALRTEDGWTLGRDVEGAANATVRIDQDSAWRIWTRGISRQEALRHIKLEGDRSLGMKVLDMVAIIA
jgi:uncharacterized protein (TIGR03083 family)